MATAGSKRPRDSDAPAPDTAASADVGAAASGVGVKQHNAATVAAHSRKKAKTVSNNEDEYDELADDDDAVPDNAPANANAATATTTAQGDVPTSTDATASKPTRRAQRKSAIAAKDKIIAAESAADEPIEDQPAAKAAGKAPAPSTTTAPASSESKPDDATAKEPSPSKPNSKSLAPPPVVHGKSRGRGGDRPDPNAPPPPPPPNPAAMAALAAQAAPPDPSNPYLVRYGDPNHPYAAIAIPPPGMMIGHNPYLPPGPGGYPMFPGMPPYPMMPMPGFEVGQPPQPPNQSPESGEGAEKKDGENAEPANPAEDSGESKEGEGGEKPEEGSPSASASAATPAVPQQHPYGAYFPPGFMPPPGFAGPHAPYGHLIPPMHHPHPPNPTTHGSTLPHPAMQLTLPLAVTDHTLPSHMDAIIRAPDSLSISYSEVPDGAFLLRTDFGEPYPKNLEPPRKTTEMRCLFCKRHYSGPNARGMWRRHVTGKHDFVFERKSGPLGTHTGGRQSHSKSAPIVMDSDHEGDEGETSGPADGPSQPPPMPPPEMTMMAHSEMIGLLSMNGMPVNGLPPGVHPHLAPIPGPGPLAMLPGTNIPIASIPPHPVAPTSKRRASAPRPGVGIGNGGGGLIPRVHPLLSKEERIERARASKRHYAMKRRALEKMKQGGIPKGARLVEGMFILADGTQIPADPNVEYRDLSAPRASGSSSNLLGGGDDGDDKKRKGKGRKKKQDDGDDGDDDEDDDEAVEGLVDASTEGLVSLDPSGMDLDPWQDQAYHQLQHLPPPPPPPVGLTPAQAYPGKLAEIPVVPRGFKPPPMHAEIPVPAPASAHVATSGRPPRKNAKKAAEEPKKVEQPPLVEEPPPVEVQPEQASSSLPPGIIPPGEDEEERRFCYCDDVEYGNMIGCDNGPKCPREWFHLACTDIKGEIPPSWYCKDCRKTLPTNENPPVDPSMEVGESSIPAAVPPPAEEPAAATEAAPAEDKELPRLRTRRTRPAKPQVESSPEPVPKKRKGGKRGRKPKQPKTDEPEVEEPEEPEDENEVESEDELEGEDGKLPATASPATAKKPVSEVKSVTESPGRTRRSARQAAAA